MEISEDIIVDYLVECHEGLDQLDKDLVDLEQSDDDRAVLDAIFRTFHTIKGGAGMLGFERLEALTHAGEEVLSRIREGHLDLSTEIASGLLALLDVVRETLQHLERDRSEGTRDITEVLASIQGFMQGDTAVYAAVKSEVTNTMPAAEAVSVASETELAAEAASAAEPQREAEKSAVAESAFTLSGSERTPAPATADLAGAVPARGRSEAEASPELPMGTVADSIIRVDVTLLDRLMNLVGELVLTRNQILQHTARTSDNALVATSQRLNLITTELQEGVMKTRMQPVGNIWTRFPRVVRDLSLALGKQVRLEMHGQDTELDKTLIEALKDPLTHIVRNAVSHGIEEPQLRLAMGKPAEGKLTLRAYHEGGQVNIEIIDDGAGIAPDRVRQKAIERGLVAPDQAWRMSDAEIVGFIFMPGFSTASTVTNISGRGVGMDVVKTNIEKIGGVIDVQNAPGRGLTLKIKIPLTLAIIPALMVTNGGDRYAIPQVNLLELVRIDLDGAGPGVEKIDTTPVYRLRGHLLPLVFLDRALGAGLRQRGDDESYNVVVLQAGEGRFGLVVDAINDTEEIVVKPLGKQIKNVPAFAGATIMGDGKVALILDVQGLAQQASIQAQGSTTVDTVVTADDEERERLLLCRIGYGRRVAIRLSEVARLEEFPSPRVERAGELDAIQYRGDILPLVSLAHCLGEPTDDSRPSTLSVVVFADEGGRFGVVVEQIIDIVDEVLRLKPARVPGSLLGSAIICGEVTDVVDLRTVVTPFRGEVAFR